VKVVVAVPPDGTVTICELPPSTAQFAATSVSATVWLPAGTPVNVTVPSVPIAWLVPSSTVTV
jgi:hypothetical protein